MRRTSSSPPTATPDRHGRRSDERAGKVMGLKVTIVNVTFDTIIPGWSPASTTSAPRRSPTRRRARRWSTSSTTPTSASRSTRKTSGGTSIKGIADICGQTVSVENGTTEETDAKTQGKKCTKAGKPAVKVLSFPTRTAPTWRCRAAGRSSASPTRPWPAYQVKQSSGQFKLVGAAYANAPYGLAVPKAPVWPRRCSRRCRCS